MIKKILKNYIFISITLVFILGIGFLAYWFVKDNINKTYKQEIQILFYKVQNRTDALLSQLLYEYSVKKEDIIKTHKKVLSMIKETKQNPLDINLSNIQDEINKAYKGKPFNIYITNKNLVIKNTTFVKDINFDLSFAKKSFMQHFNDGTAEPCSPLFEKSSKSFLSYTDQYLDADKNNLLQISYSYNKSSIMLNELQKLIDEFSNIVESKAYILVDTGFVNDIILKDFPSYKPSLQEIEDRISQGLNVKNNLKSSSLVVKHINIDDKLYTKMYMRSKSPILDEVNVIFYILLDESGLKRSLNSVDFIGFLLLVLLIVIFYFVFVSRKNETEARKNEKLLKEQDDFITAAVHEIQTPLSTISMYNSFRDDEFGVDENSKTISNSIKRLEFAYEIMSASKLIDIETHETRLLYIVDYIDIVLDKYGRENIRLNIKDEECVVEISEYELQIIIINIINNALKYSYRDKIVDITLDANILMVHNFGEPIKNKTKIFEKNYRENRVVGGHGIGLSLVKTICDKYNIEIKVDSDEKNGTTFKLIFKCHTLDIPTK